MPSTKNQTINKRKADHSRLAKILVCMLALLFTTTVFATEEVTLVKEAPNTPPARVKSLSDQLLEQVADTLNTVGSTNSAVKKLSNLQVEHDRSQYFLQYATGTQYIESERTSESKVRNQLQREAENAVAQRFFENLPVFQSFKKGLNFNLDFSNSFGGSRRQTTDFSSAQNKSVRYGLILKSIEAKKDLTRAQAAIGTTPETDLAYLTTAKVEWTIGLLEEEEGRRLFNASPDLESYEEYDDNEFLTRRVSPGETDEYFWNNGGIPLASFKTNVKPLSTGNLNLDNLLNNNGVKVEMLQEQGVYRMDLSIPSGQEMKLEQEVKVPLVGTMSIGRKYDTKLDVIYTSANNILVKKDLPKVSVHYFEQTKQLVCDGALQPSRNVQMTFRFKDDAKNVSDADQELLRYRKSYEVGIRSAF